MAARVGLAGRRGLAEAIRDSLTNPLIRTAALGLMALTILAGNAAFQTGNLLGASLGLNLITGLPQGLAGGDRRRARGRPADDRRLQCHPERARRPRRTDERVFFLVAVLSAPDFGALLSGLPDSTHPAGRAAHRAGPDRHHGHSLYLFLHASAVLERWPDAHRNEENIRESRQDTLFSVALGGLITAAVVIAAAPLLGQGADAADAATVAARLEPLLGSAAPVFFGVGLFSAGVTSAITAPLAAAYAAGGALGWGSDLRSPRFRLLWGFVLLTGMFCGNLPGDVAVPDHPARPGRKRDSAAADAGLPDDRREPRRHHGQAPQLAPRQCFRRIGGSGHLRTRDGADGPGPRSGGLAPEP